MSTEKINENATPLTTGENTTVFASEESPAPGIVVVQGNEYVQHEPPPRQGRLCCGCCCDTRRAVIVVNIVSLSFAVLAILSLSLMTSDRYAAQFDDDEVQTASNEIDGAAVGITIQGPATIGIAVLGMICNTAGLFGAFKFNKIGIIVAAIWYSAECVRSLLFYDIAGAIMAGLFAYPHVVFYQEMKKGIMTPENYPNEDQCCVCCV
jgi:hypothetical protein